MCYSERPVVKWCQSRWNVLVIVAVKGAEDVPHTLDNVVNLTPDTLKFRWDFEPHSLVIASGSLGVCTL